MPSTAISRRQWLGGMALAAGSLALPRTGWTAGPRFTHGVASGDPLADRVILWTRALPSASGESLDLRWEVATDRDFARTVASGRATARPERDHTVKVDVTGLEPGRRYYYRFRAGEETSPVGRTKTLPADGARQAKLAVVSCSNYPQGFFNVYKEIAGRDDLDAVLHLGDYLYEYPQGGYANDYAVTALGRGVRPEGEILALADYRARYALYRDDADLQAVHAAHPMIAVWDDHESANNSWKGGAENHDPNDGEGDWAERRRAAVRAYREWMPIRESGPDDPRAIYRHFQFGGLADLFMLETRLVARSQQLTYEDDLLYRRVAFDVSDPDAPRLIRDPARLEQLPADSIERLRVPYDLRGEKPRPIRDYAWIKSLESTGLPEGIAYLPDAERFRDQKLASEDRAMLGAEQLDWLEDGFAQSKAPWQLLGQQVLMGRLRAPDLLDVADFSESSFLSRERGRQMTRLGELGLPLNLDSWDGYPAARERVYAAARRNARNFVSLAGDSHNAWAFNLADAAGEPVGVEFGATSVSSPGIESYLPAPSGVTAERFVAANPELVAMNAARRGWLELTITGENLTARWQFVSTVLSKDYHALTGPAFRVAADTHRIAG